LEFIRLMELHAEQVHARVLEGGGKERIYENLGGSFGGCQGKEGRGER